MAREPTVMAGGLYVMREHCAARNTCRRCWRACRGSRQPWPHAAEGVAGAGKDHTGSVSALDHVHLSLQSPSLPLSPEVPIMPPCSSYRPSYRKEQAQDGWNRLVAWCKQHGVA